MKPINVVEYSQMFKKTKVKFKGYPVVAAIGMLLVTGEKVSNLAVSRVTGLTPVRVGQVTTEMEANGVLEDVSTHPLRKNWVLTDLGKELLEFINDNTED